MKPIQKIPLEQIDLSDDTFSVNFMPDIERLRSSIRAVGLIQPALLVERHKGFRVLCGFRRVTVLRELGYEAVEAGVIEEGESDHISLFTIVLYENMTTRGLNFVEKAIALDKLIHDYQIDRKEVIKTFLPLLSLETHEKILNTFLSLARMEDPVKRFVVEEEVSRSNIRILSMFTPEDRMALLALFSSLKLGENRLREVLTLLDEIARRDHLAVKEVLQRPEIQELFTQKELTPAQRVEHLKRVLLTLRYPRRRQLEDRFEQKKRGLNLPQTISLSPPPNFEGKKIRISFEFETLEEFQSLLSLLSPLTEKTEFKELMENLIPPRLPLEKGGEKQKTEI
jgi:ParB family chromosome partitioning protein